MRIRSTRARVRELRCTVLWLIDKWNASPAQIPEETRQRASTLFDAINRHFVN